VSVTIVTYNSGRFIKRCLESVLAQKYPYREVIIIDNNSTDGTISGFSFNAGAISATPLPNSPFPTEKQPQALVEDSSKTYLIDVGFSTNPNLWMYSLDPTSLGSLDVKTTTSTVSTSPSQAIALAVTH